MEPTSMARPVLEPYDNRKKPVKGQAAPSLIRFRAACFLLAAGVAVGCTKEAVGAEPPVCRADFAQADGTYPFLRKTPIAEIVRGPIRIQSILYSRLAVFDESDPEENRLLYRWANRAHVLTRERTLDQQLLIEPDAVVEARLLDESARLLREQDYLFDADLRIVSLCESDATVEVITKDNWSLTPNLAFDRSGGDNTYSVGLRESNLLGLGKLLGIARGKNLERESTRFIYQDPNVLGSRVRNKTTLIDSDDGEQQLFELSLPFFSLDSQRSWAVRFNRETREDTQYRLGEALSEVLHELDSAQLLYGWSAGLVGDRFTRWSAGIRYQRDRFSDVPGLPPPAHSPRERRLTYPFLQIEQGENRYATAFNFDEILRTEDIYIGASLLASIGYAIGGMASDQDRLIVNGQYRDTLLYDSRRLWQYALDWEGILNVETGHSEDVLLEFSSRYFARQSDRWTLYASLTGSYSINLSGERQLLAGGDSGARGFDTRFQAGDRRLVLNLEQRLHTDVHLLNLLRIGAAGFVDVARAWESGGDSGLDDPWLVNAGIGLRLASSKAASSRIAHLDFAIPLTNRGHPAVEDLQIAFYVRSRF